MTILDEIKPCIFTQAFVNVSTSDCMTVQCLLCSYGSPESLVSAPRQVHLFKHVMKYHWVWWLSLEWDGEVPPARYRDWRRSNFFKQSTGGGGGQFSSDSEDNLCDTWMHCDPNTCAGTVHRVSGGTATPCDMYDADPDFK